jgi:hypothetical protein
LDFDFGCGIDSDTIANRLTMEVNMKRMIPSFLSCWPFQPALSPKRQIRRSRRLCLPRPHRPKPELLSSSGRATSYDTLRKGTNRLVCYDRPVALAVSRSQWNARALRILSESRRAKKTETIVDPQGADGCIQALEKAGKWTKPEFGSIFYNFGGDQAARSHATIAMPGRYDPNAWSSRYRRSGGAWIMNARHVCSSHHDAGPLEMRFFIGGLILIAGLSSAQGKRTFVGAITDGMCAAADHSKMRMGSNDAECTIACVDAHRAAYVLYDGKDVYTLSDQRRRRSSRGEGFSCRHAQRRNESNPGGFDYRSELRNSLEHKGTSQRHKEAPTRTLQWRPSLSATLMSLCLNIHFESKT